MNTLLFTLILALSVTCLPVVNGPIASSLGNTPYRMAMSKDARLIVLTFATSKNAEVFQNNGYGFEFNQSIPNTVGCYDLAMTEYGTYIYFNKFYAKRVMVFKRIDGNYEFFQNVSNPQLLSSVHSSLDGEYLITGSLYGLIRIFKLTDQYTLIQAIYAFS